MWNDTFVLAMMIMCGTFLAWGFKVLPRDGWQILASVPVSKNDQHSWKGMNFTYYGLLLSLSCLTAATTALILMGSVGVSGRMGLTLTAIILGACVPASRLTAKLVEKKEFTFSVGGASFIAVITVPLLLWVLNRISIWAWDTALPQSAVLASLSIAYVLGEGLGRLACISFGCCYGKPLDRTSPLTRKLLCGHEFTFFGDTKKIAYEGNLEGKPVVPIQAITSVVLLTAGFFGMLLFFRGRFVESMLVCLIVTQLWRVISEVLRADFRGGGAWSAYQTLAVLSTLYIAFISRFITDDTVTIDIGSGLSYLWDPAIILSLEILFAAIFLFTGKSMVTGSTITFHVVRKNI